MPPPLNVRPLLAALVAFSCAGCGWRGGLVRSDAQAHRDTPHLHALRVAHDQYSRNGIVCGPTYVGNVLGAAAGSPFFLIGWWLKTASLEKTGSAVMTAGWVPVYIVGGALGTPFLPFSYLAKEDPCTIDMH